MPARAPTDPDVRALAHPVPRPTGWPSATVPAAIRSSYGDMHKNLDVFNMFPSISSAGRRFASLHRVLRGEFPCFIGTIKALRLPAVHPAALRYVRLAVPQRSLVVFAPRRTSAPPKPGVDDPVSPAGTIAEETAGPHKFLGNPDCPFAMFSRRRQDCWHQTINDAAAWPLVWEQQRLLRKGFRRSIDGFWTGCLRLAVRVAHAPRQTRFRPLVRRYRTGFPPAGFR